MLVLAPRCHLLFVLGQMIGATDLVVSDLHTKLCSDANFDTATTVFAAIGLSGLLLLRLKLRKECIRGFVERLLQLG